MLFVSSGLFGGPLVCIINTAIGIAKTCLTLCFWMYALSYVASDELFLHPYANSSSRYCTASQRTSTRSSAVAAAAALRRILARRVGSLLIQSIIDNRIIRMSHCARRPRALWLTVGVGWLNPLMGTLKPQSNGPPIQQYGDWYTGHWWVGYIWYSEEGHGLAAAPRSPLLAVPNVTAHPSTATVSTSYYSM